MVFKQNKQKHLLYKDLLEVVSSGKALALREGDLQEFTHAARIHKLLPSSLTARFVSSSLPRIIIE